MNKPKRVGTAAESEVVKALHRAGLPAHRNALAGHLDEGDIHALDGRLVIEVKAGEQTRKPSWRQLSEWMAETEREASRVVRCDLGILVVRRWGSGQAEDWHAHVHLDDLGNLLTHGPTSPQLPRVPTAMRLGDLLDLIADHYLTEQVTP